MEEQAKPVAGGPVDAAAQQLTEAEVKQMQMVVKQALGVLLEDDNAKFIVDKAKQGDPKTVVVEAVAPLLQNIYGAADAAGTKVNMVVVLAAGIQIIAVLAKMLEAGDILTEDQIPSFCADVSKMAVAQHNQKAQTMGGQTPAGMPAAPSAPGGMMNAAPPQGASA